LILNFDSRIDENFEFGAVAFSERGGGVRKTVFVLVFWNRKVNDLVLDLVVWLVVDFRFDFDLGWWQR